MKDGVVGGGETLTIHLPHGSHVVVWILEADKAVTFGLSCPFISHHLETNMILWSFLACTKQKILQQVPVWEMHPLKKVP